MNAVIKNNAPTCALPGCIRKVAYHNTKAKTNGTTSVKYKMFCEHHRKRGKAAVDQWKLNQGCSNIDAHHGFKCTATIFGAEQLDINHIDGNRYNSDLENLEVLCRNCHSRVTVQENHHLNRYSNQVDTSNNELWEEEEEYAL